jgi:electron transfer flavoprotein beta subunit
VEAPLPALVTVSNELGEPRYPTLRGIMAASRKTPTVWTAADLGLSAESLAPKLELQELFIPVSDAQCEFIEGEDEADAGRKLALRLREARLI